ncbi:hypothetical protein [Capnocytophaga stomatis]|uniref:Uncharacterized protein n=1 Tax=Capnocytophaga stomatis TaxID=1848904 RepID=A0ABW8Q8F2_9FLAO
MKKRGSNKLGNPAAVAAVTSYAAKNPKMVNKAVNVGFVLVGLTIASIGGFAFYTLYWKNRFIPIKTNPNDRASNITPSQASLRAQKLYNAMVGVGNGYKQVYEAFKGLNRNAFVLVYNAFGKRKPATDVLGFGNKSHMTLTEWMADQFSDSELQNLRFIIQGGGQGLF